jgi:glycolate oxidase FAD binding subunit
LGFEGLLADGTPIKAGGRVVKNVSGYDLMKLIAGSLGTLAVITRAHLRLRPTPEVVKSWVATYNGLDEVSEAISHLRRTFLYPEAVVVLEPGLALPQSPSTWTVLLRLEGLEEEVEAQAKRAREACGTSMLLRQLDANEQDELWRMVCDFPHPEEHPPLPVVMRGQATPTRALELAEAWSQLGLRMAFPDSGLVYARSDDTDVYVRGLEVARDLGAGAVLEAGPRELKAEADVFGDLPDGFPIMRAVKDKMDPKGILSPGRFVGRL